MAFDNNWHRFVSGILRASGIDPAKTYRLTDSRPARAGQRNSTQQHGRYQTTVPAHPAVQVTRGPTSVARIPERIPARLAAKKAPPPSIWSPGLTEEEKRKWVAKTLSPEKAIAPRDACEHRNADGVCVYMKDAKGNVVYTPEYERLACRNFEALQEGATKTNDGFTAIALTGRKVGGKPGEILGDGASFGAFVSSLSTGAGYRPFGFEIVPKTPLPQWCSK